MRRSLETQLAAVESRRRVATDRREKADLSIRRKSLRAGIRWHREVERWHRIFTNRAPKAEAPA